MLLLFGGITILYGLYFLFTGNDAILAKRKERFKQYRLKTSFRILLLGVVLIAMHVISRYM